MRDHSVLRCYYDDCGGDVVLSDDPLGTGDLEFLVLLCHLPDLVVGEMGLDSFDDPSFHHAVSGCLYCDAVVMLDVGLLSLYNFLHKCCGLWVFC